MTADYNHGWPRGLALVQGLYFFVTGVWPLVHAESFMCVTGPKVDVWLLQTTGLLIVCIAVQLLRAARRRRIDGDTALLAVSSALALAGIDVYYGAVVDRIRDVYLVDAAIELVFAALWLIASQRRPRRVDL